MKVELAVTLDVDPDEWMAEHHRGGKTVEDDVASYMWMVFESLGPVQDGAITAVKVTALKDGAVAEAPGS